MLYPDLWVFVDPANWISAPNAPPPWGFQGNGSQKFLKMRIIRLFRENCWIWLLLSLNCFRLINAILFAENNFTLWVAFGFLFPLVYIIFYLFYFIIKKTKSKQKKGLGLLACGLGTPLACDDTLGFWNQSESDVVQCENFLFIFLCIF